MGALSAPSSPQQIRILNAVIATVSVISAVGAGWIILSFVASRHTYVHVLLSEIGLTELDVQGSEKLPPSTYSVSSHYLLLNSVSHETSGLAISDFLMALNFLSSAATNLGGPNIGSKEVKAFCDFNGYMIETFVVQST